MRFPTKFALCLAVVEGRHEFGHAQADDGEWKVASKQPGCEVVEVSADIKQAQRYSEAWWSASDSLRGDGMYLAGVHIAIGDDVAFPGPASLGREQHGACGVLDADDF